MWWQAAGVIASLITAITGLGLGVAGFVRSGRAEDAQLRTGSTEVGLKHLELALNRAEADIKRQEGLIGKLTGQLDECLRQREHQENQLIDQARELAELKKMVS